jgi:putative ABC transport system substrate-binding protein
MEGAMNNRRKLIVALGAGALAAPFGSFAQQTGKMRRIGVFFLTSAKASADWVAAFRAGMVALGWVEGRDYVVEARYANGVVQAGPVLAAELVATQPDLVLTGAEEAVRQLSQGAKTLPIVFGISQDPVGSGIAASLQRPGGNATGLTSMASDLGAKRLQLLKEAFPRIAHVVLLFDPADVGNVSQLKIIEEAGASLRIRVTRIESGQAADTERAFKRGAALGAQAYLVAQGRFASSQIQSIVDHITHAKVPAMLPDSQFVEAGGLMSYAPSYPDNFRRAAAYADKILKGAKPGDLPVEQPIKFELAINMKTAKTLGIKIPQSILVQATKVIG